jgi:hypothetical protein
MLVYREEMAPPVNSLKGDEPKKTTEQSIAEEDDLWVKYFIDCLAGVVRDFETLK